MEAMQKSMISQVMQSSAETALLLALSPESSIRICVATLEEIRRLSQFLPLIVLIPKASVKDRALASNIADKSKADSSERELLGLLGKTLEPLAKPHSGGEAAFGEVTVNFSEM